MILKMFVDCCTHFDYLHIFPGGRITVFQHILPKLGPGALPNRESPAESKNSSDSSLLGPATDFYKKMSLDCSGQQVTTKTNHLTSVCSLLA